MAPSGYAGGREKGGTGEGAPEPGCSFYADDGMIALTDPRWLQWAFTSLVGLFDRVGLKTNQHKTVSMACWPCNATGNRSEKSYKHTMTGKGLSPKERKRERVTCGECGQEMAAASLDSHRMSQHGRARERKWTWTDAATGGENPRLIGWSSRKEEHRYAQLKGVRGGQGRT